MKPLRKLYSTLGRIEQQVDELSERIDRIERLIDSIQRDTERIRKRRGQGAEELSCESLQ